MVCFVYQRVQCPRGPRDPSKMSVVHFEGVNFTASLKLKLILGKSVGKLELVC